MASDTKIEWATKVWNPVRGCSRVSEGCRNCYAERQAMRFSGKGQPYAGLVGIANGHPQWTGIVRVVHEAHPAPLQWNKPQRIFVNSMSDLFHEAIPTEAILEIFEVMAHAKQHSFLILTKRPERMKHLLAYGEHLQCDSAEHHRLLCTMPLPNVWLGVSVEDQFAANERIPLLLETPAAVRWVSYEPALGPVDFDEWLKDGHPTLEQINDPDVMKACRYIRHGAPRLDWIVAGGESGPGARPAHPDWFRRVRDDCQAAGVPFFFKQWGAWHPWELQFGIDGVCHIASDGRLGDFKGSPGWVRNSDGKNVMAITEPIARIGKKRAGRLLGGREWNEFPQSLKAQSPQNSVDTGHGKK